MNTFVRLLYSLLIAVAVVAFVGVAIFSFYQPPKMPSYPTIDYLASTATQDSQRQNYSTASKKYDANNKSYERNVAIALLPLAVVVMASGIYFSRKLDVIGEGLALGGVAISIYAIIAASIANARILRFLAVTLLLINAILIARARFKPTKAKTA